MPFCFPNLYDKHVLFFLSFQKKVILCKREIKLIIELWLIKVYTVEAREISRMGNVPCGHEVGETVGTPG